MLRQTTFVLWEWPRCRPLGPPRAPQHCGLSRREEEKHPVRTGFLLIPRWQGEARRFGMGCLRRIRHKMQMPEELQRKAARSSAGVQRRR